MESLVEIFKNIAAVIGCISACIALTTTIVKPVRQRFIDSIMHKSQYQGVLDSVEDMHKKIDKMLADNEITQERLLKLEQNALESEADRLKSELSDYYNRCCRGMQIFPEEMLRVDEVYHRYHDELHLNHIGTNMYDVIAQYYKSQDFLQESCNHHN